MEAAVTIIQMIIALSILNVWLLRRKKATNWRGGMAQNMREEFEVYGLPGWFMGGVGFLKVLFALSLIGGIWFPALTKPAAIGMVILMLVAVSMHLKARDPLLKSLPAFTLFVLSLIVVTT